MKYALSGRDRVAVLRIVTIYAVFAALWIYFSDHALESFAQDPAFLIRIGVLKGFLFIIVTGVLLYQLMARDLRKSREIGEELRATQNLMNALLAGTTDAIYVKDPQGRYLLFNPAAENFTGKKAPEAIGHDDTLLFSAEDAGVIMAGDRKVMDAGRVMTYEENVTAADGKSRTFLSTKGPIVNAAGEVCGLFGIARDITDRKREEAALQASEGRFRSLFENMLDGFAYCRMVYAGDKPLDFVYLDVNPAFTRLTGLKNVVGKKVSEVLPGIRESSPELFEIYGRVASSGKPEEFEIYLEAMDEWFSVSVYSPEKEHFVALFEIITPRKRAEESREATVELLRLCNQANDFRALMQRLTRYFQQFTGCEAVGVRLREGDDFPYFETRGFPEEFILLENRLCAKDPKGELIRDEVGHPALDCMCGNILSGRFDPAKPFFSPRGSFWSSGTTELLASTTEADRQARTRNRCNGEGYESVALVPLRTHGETFGLFQFNDKRKGRFSPEKIALLEDLVEYVAIALAKLKSDEALRESGRFNQQIIDSAEEGVIVHGPDLRFQVWNPFMEKLSGLTAGEVLGKHPLELFPFLKQADVITRLEKALAGQLSATFEFPYHYARSGRSGWLSDTYAPLRNTKGGIIGVIATVRDITERKRAAEAVRQKEELLRMTGEMAKVGGWEFEAKTLKGAWTDEVARIHDLDPATDTNVELGLSFYAGENREKIERAIKDAIESAKPYDLELEMISAKGRHKWVRTMGVPIWQDGKVVKVRGIIQDITERKKAEEALREAGRFSQQVIDGAGEGIIVHGLDLRCQVWNSFMERLEGLRADEVLGRHPLELFPFLKETGVLERLERALKGETSASLEYPYHSFRSGRSGWVSSTCAPLRNTKGEIIGVIATVRDVTAKKRAEDSLRDSLEEKVALLKEVHHRVKNNLQIVASLLNLQTSRVQNREVAEILQDTRNRVHSMALLHEALYRSGNLARINFAAYVDELGRHLLRSFGSAALRVRLENRVAQIGLPLEQSVPCGLIINELVSNALKHAFPGDRAGRIAVELTPATGQRLNLYVRDNGVGLPAGLNPENAPTLGLHLVSSLAAQLGGQLTVGKAEGGGTLFHVVFPIRGEDSPESRS